MREEKNQTPSQGRMPNEEDSKNGAQAGLRIGALLRNEREKRGLTYEQIFEITRLRPATLEALENEDWDRLPAPVFVTGFIRAYARGLGLEEKRVEGLYEKVDLPNVKLPKPPIEPIKGKKNFSVFLTFLLFALVFAYYLREEYSTRTLIPMSPHSVSTGANEAGASKGGRNHLRQRGPVSLVQRNEANSASQFDLGLNGTEILVDSSMTGTVSPAAVEKAAEALESGHDLQVTPQELLLRADVRAGTWVRIYVDDQAPKEYVFRPGSRPQWRAEKGFELLIGNAGGIGLEFEGKRIEKLGNLGEVVRLRLPENYERRHSQN